MPLDGTLHKIQLEIQTVTLHIKIMESILHKMNLIQTVYTQIKDGILHKMNYDTDGILHKIN